MAKKPLPNSIPRTTKLIKNEWGVIEYQAWGLGDQSKLLQRLGDDTPSEERYDALRELLSSCVVSYSHKGKQQNPLEMPVFLSELLLLKLRSISIGEEAKFSKKCDCDGTPVVSLVANLEDAKILTQDTHKDTWTVGNFTFQLQYPSFRGSIEMSELESLEHISEEMVSRFIKTVYTDDDVWDMCDYTQDEKNVFMKDLGSDFQLFVLDKFISKMPQVVLPVTGTCEKCGKDHSMDLKGIARLFSK